MSRGTSPREGTFETGEFVEIEYTARIADGDEVVDTTDPSVADDAELTDLDADGPITVVLGEGHVFRPVEDAITALRPGASETVVVPPSDAFGEPDPARRVSIPVESVSRESIAQNDRIVLDDQVGYVDAVEDGSVTIDFNHPLAGTTLTYELRVLDRLVDFTDRVDGLLRLYELQDEVAVTGDGGTLECEASRSSLPDSEWDGRRRQFIEAAMTHLDIEEVRFEEEYATN